MTTPPSLSLSVTWQASTDHQEMRRFASLLGRTQQLHPAGHQQVNSHLTWPSPFITRSRTCPNEKTWIFTVLAPMIWPTYDHLSICLFICKVFISLSIRPLIDKVILFFFLFELFFPNQSHVFWCCFFISVFTKYSTSHHKRCQILC